MQPARNADGRAIRATQDGFINWKLPPGAARIATASGAKTMPKPDRLVCRKDIKTGSLVATMTQCLTRAEWRHQEQVTKDEIDRIQGKLICGQVCLPGE